MKIIGVIPARLKSTRLPEKLLKEINGYPLIYYTYTNARKSKLDDVIIAADSKKIINSLKKYDIPAVLTSKKHKTGTDRIGEIAKSARADFIINIQADEPLINPKVINEIIKFVSKNKKSEVVTLAKLITAKSELLDSNVVKVVFDNSFNALYFSRLGIPFNRDNMPNIRHYKHIGVYCYRKDILLRINRLNETLLEKSEKLEQLRFLQNGINIKMIITKYDTVGVDTAKDFKRVKNIILKNEVIF